MDMTALDRGFLPPRDPLTMFDPGSPYALLDQLGRDLPSLLVDSGFRRRMRQIELPEWCEPDGDTESRLRQARLYYVRVGFLASAYINQVGEPTETVLPRALAVPLCRIAERLDRPPILSYDGYALFNWRRFDPHGPIALGNIDTLQDFVHLYDEHWFILVHVEIEAIGAESLAAMVRAGQATAAGDAVTLNAALAQLADSIWRQVAVLRRIPEHMDPALYFKTFRPYIRFFENVVYEGVDTRPMQYRGETGAQSSLVPAVVTFMKIPHRQSLLTDHLADMRRFMPAEHRRVLEDLAAMPDVRPLADATVYNDVLEALATFRETHIGWASEYIHQRVADPRGTGGTPYMQWLGQLIDETRAHKK